MNLIDTFNGPAITANAFSAESISFDDLLKTVDGMRAKLLDVPAKVEVNSFTLFQLESRMRFENQMRCGGDPLFPERYTMQGLPVYKNMGVPDGEVWVFNCHGEKIDTLRVSAV